MQTWGVAALSFIVPFASIGVVSFASSSIPPVANEVMTFLEPFPDEGPWVASPTPLPTPTPSPTPSSIPTLKPAPTPPVQGWSASGGKPTPTPEPSPPWAAGTQLDEWFTRFANEYHVDRTLLHKIALCESGMNQYAKNGDYGGLYQFSTSSWKSARSQLGHDNNPNLRFNAEEAIKTAAYKISISGPGVWPNCSK